MKIEIIGVYLIYSLEKYKIFYKLIYYILLLISNVLEVRKGL